MPAAGAWNDRSGSAKWLLSAAASSRPGLVVEAQDRVEVRLQVVDLVLEAVAPDLERDALAFRQLEGIPVDVFGLADPARDDARARSDCCAAAGRSLARSSRPR